MPRQDTCTIMYLRWSRRRIILYQTVWGGKHCQQVRGSSRKVLKEAAKYCGQAEGTEEIFASLRVRFKLSAREATSMLTSIRKEHETSLAKHAVEVGETTGGAGISRLV